MPYLGTAIGAGAAFCTTISYVPQLRKCWTTGESPSTCCCCSRAAWHSGWAYGFIRSDWVVIAANGVSLTLLACILCFKLRNNDC
jgi:MtN3 and saliva related transmembrane protein